MRITVAFAAAVILLVGLANPARAELYKCVDAEGKVQFVDLPCNEGTSQQSLDIKEESLEGRAWARGVQRPQSDGSWDIAFYCISTGGRRVSGGAMVCDEKRKKCASSYDARTGQAVLRESMNSVAMRTCGGGRASRRYNGY